MKVLVIGSTAVIGRAIADRLTHAGGEVQLAGRREADVPFDLTEWNRLPETEQAFDAVVHVAADFGGTTDADYIRAELVNAVGTLSACALAQRVGARHFILLSSLSSTYEPGNPYYGIYALTKRHSEEVAQFYCAKRAIPLTILRPSQIYDDASACRRHQPLFYMVADQAEVGADIGFFGSHDARRNYLHIEDLAEIVARVIQGRHTGLFTCAHPQSVRLSEMAESAYKAFGTSGRVNFLRDKADVADLPPIADFCLYNEIGMGPAIDILEGYRRIREFRGGML